MMIWRALLLAALAAWGGAAVAAEFCLRPVMHDPPLSALEERQPHRLASSVLIYPGFPKPVIYPTNRGGLYTIDGDRYVKLEAEWPRSSLWEFGNYFVRPNGEVFGIKSHPLALFKLQQDSGAFERFRLPVFDQVRYDEALDKIIVWTRNDGAFHEVVGSGLKSLDLGPLRDMLNGALPRYVPRLNGWVAATSQRIYFAKAGEDWQALPVGRGRVSLHQLEVGPVHFNETDGVLTIFLGSVALVYRVGQDGVPGFAYRVDEVRSRWLSATLPLVSIAAKSTTFWGKPRGLDGFGKVMQVLTPEGAEDVTALPLFQGAQSDISLLWRALRDKRQGTSTYFSPPLFRLNGETFLFADRARIAVPHLSDAALGDHPRWVRWQDRLFVLGRHGWAELLPDLSLQKGAFPVEVTHAYLAGDFAVSDQLGLVAAIKGDLWRSTDGLTFEKLSDAGDGYVNKFLSDLPLRSDMLVNGKEGLMLLHTDCD